MSTPLTREGKSVLLQTALMSSLTEASAMQITEKATETRLSRGATVFHRGDPADSLYVVVEGWVKVSRVTAAGSEAVLAVCTQGQSFAEAAVFLSGVYPASAQAVTDVHLVSVPTKPLLALITSQPDVALAMLASMSRHLHQLVGDIEALKTRSGTQRVAEFLFSLVRTASGSTTVTLPYEKALIAARIGIKPESLSRALSRLRQFGVDAKNGEVYIADVEALRDYVSADEG